MINDTEALLGYLIIVILIYFFLWRRSKIIGGGTLFISSFVLLIPFGGTDYEIMAWIGIFSTLIVLVAEFAYAKLRPMKRKSSMRS